jgi:hypothetical protein
MGVEILEDNPVVYIRAVDPDYAAPAAPAEELAEETAEGDLGAETTHTSTNISAVAPVGRGVAANEGGHEMADFKGEATVALPRTFDWLHVVCFYAEGGIAPPWARDSRKGWHTIHEQTKKPEVWTRNWSPRSVYVIQTLRQLRSISLDSGFISRPHQTRRTLELCALKPRHSTNTLL